MILSEPERLNDRRIRIRSTKTVVNELSEMPVPYLDGNFMRLKYVSLLRESILRKPGGYFFLSVPDPELDAWDFVHLFGVKIKTGLAALDSEAGKHMQRLKELRGGYADHSIKSVLQLYHDIGGS